MRVLICTPQQPQTTGNWVTAQRYASNLSRLGLRVQITEVTLQGDELSRAVAAYQPELIHLLHAFRSGKPWRECRAAQAIPMAVSLTGTDINEGLSHPHSAATIRCVLERAGAIISQNRLTITDLKQQMPDLAPRLHCVPPAAELGVAVVDIRQQLGIDESTPILLHPASIRPIKRNLELLHLLADMAHYQRFQAVFCGPILDAAYGDSFLQTLALFPWAHYAGELPTAAMPSVIKTAQAVLNHSHSEGLPNALVEATALRVPILASAIQGNQAIVEDGVNGYCYRNAQDFKRRLTQLLGGDLPCTTAPSDAQTDLINEARHLQRIYQQVLQTHTAGH